MDTRIVYPQPLMPGIGKPVTGITPHPNAKASEESFQKILDQKALKFSAHALQRLTQRNIKLDDAEISKLNEAVDKASQRGARESLILMKDMALVVSIKNRTVITAVDGSAMKDNVFTNIDSAVIVPD
ncbi:TIGR02530 family flagellar biosynthesis protein [Heliobacterium chlorum]